MDYIFTITEYDADDVDSSFTVNHGRIEHWINLTAKTYETRRKADEIPTQIIYKVWEENIPLIQSFIDREINRINAQILLEKTRIYELAHFSAYIKIGPTDIQDAQNALDASEATLAYLKNYILT